MQTKLVFPYQCKLSTATKQDLIEFATHSGWVDPGDTTRCYNLEHLSVQNADSQLTVSRYGSISWTFIFTLKLRLCVVTTVCTVVFFCFSSGREKRHKNLNVKVASSLGSKSPLFVLHLKLIYNTLADSLFLHILRTCYLMWLPGIWSKWTKDFVFTWVNRG